MGGIADGRRRLALRVGDNRNFREVVSSIPGPAATFFSCLAIHSIYSRPRIRTSYFSRGTDGQPTRKACERPAASEAVQAGALLASRWGARRGAVGEGVPCTARPTRGDMRARRVGRCVVPWHRPDASSERRMRQQLTLEDQTAPAVANSLYWIA